MDAPSAASAIGATLPQLELLRRNAAFPTPLSDDGGGNVSWADGDIDSFAAIYAETLANGWRIDDTELPTFDFAMGATTLNSPL